jgi:hypothetical protein
LFLLHHQQSIDHCNNHPWQDVLHNFCPYNTV